MDAPERLLVARETLARIDAKWPCFTCISSEYAFGLIDQTKIVTAASELAALSLIRPSATCGHLGDVVGDKLIYDAPTAHGGSGGPVFNTRGEVIGVNSAYMDGFSGGTLGVAVESLRPLIERAQRQK